MATEAGTVAAIADAAEIQKRLELKALLQKPYKWIDRSWDLVFWVTAIFVVGGAADITKQLFAGDWDFWTDWKDPQWWPVITAFATIIIPSTGLKEFQKILADMVKADGEIPQKNVLPTEG